MAQSNHMVFAELESAMLEPNSFDVWLERVELEVGHNLDGDQSTDGFSIDTAFESFRKGFSPTQHATAVRLRKAVLAIAHKWEN